MIVLLALAIVFMFVLGGSAYLLVHARPRPSVTLTAPLMPQESTAEIEDTTRQMNVVWSGLQLELDLIARGRRARDDKKNGSAGG